MRFGPLPDSTATAKRLLVPPRVVFAAPSYLGRAGTPTTPADLASHSVIVGPSRLGRSWSFTKNGKATSVGVNSRLVATYNEVGLTAAVAGLGLVSMTAGAARKEVAQGYSCACSRIETWARSNSTRSSPAGKAAKPAARALIDFLIAEFAKDPGLTPRPQRSR